MEKASRKKEVNLLPTPPEDTDKEYNSLINQIHSFFDPISLDIMSDPVLINGEGLTYDNSTLRLWVQECVKNGLEVTSPLSGKPFQYPEDITVNFTLKNAIEEVSVKMKSLVVDGNDSSQANSKWNLRQVLCGSDGPIKGISSDIFESLDHLQDFDLMQTLKLKTPQIIVLGNEKDGKSTLLERLAGFPIFPSRRSYSTLCPIRVHLRRREASVATVSVRTRGTGIIDRSKTKQVALQLMSKIIQEIMDEMLVDSGIVSPDMPNRKSIIPDREILVEIQLPYCPNLDLLDLPGLVAHPQEVNEATIQLAESVIKEEGAHSIFVMVVKSLSNPSLSFATGLVRKYDLFQKTLGVMTFLDAFHSVDEEEISSEDALREFMSPHDQNYFDLRRPWLGCASKLPSSAKDMNPMNKLIHMEMEEAEILKKKFPSFLKDAEPRLGLTVIRNQVSAEFEKFICENWVENMSHHLTAHFQCLSDDNISRGFPMPFCDSYCNAVFELLKILPEIIPNYDVQSMLKLNGAQEFSDIVFARTKIVCANGQWLKLNELSHIENGLKKLENYTLSPLPVEFDKSFQEVQRVEDEVLTILDNIKKDILEHGKNVSKLFVAAVLKEADPSDFDVETANIDIRNMGKNDRVEVFFKEKWISGTILKVLPESGKFQVRCDEVVHTLGEGVLLNATQENMRPFFVSSMVGITQFNLANFKPGLQTSVLKVNRFNGMLESYFVFMEENISSLNRNFEIRSNELLEELKGHVVFRKHLWQHSRVEVLLSWDTDIVKFGNKLVSLWLDTLTAEIPKFTSTWTVPETCLQEIITEERAKLLKDMVDVAHVLEALKQLKEKYLSANPASIV